jgi:septal ring factor EnvC (AmiA/AmiB activator)
MDVNRSGRKRKNSSPIPDRSPISHRTRQSLAAASEDVDLNQKRTPSATPKKSRKRVRFSDPGPRLLQDVDIGSTGLTPAMRRTSCNPSSGDRTPSRKARRRSASTPRFSRSYDPEEPYDETCTERRYQFTPLRQILDTRTQRRIKRIGLSDEINHIEREKRDMSKFEKTMQALRQERDALKAELRSVRRNAVGFEDQDLTAESYWMTSQTSRSCDAMSVASNNSLDDTIRLASSDGDTFLFNDSAVIMSSSPDLRGMRGHNSLVPDSLALFEEPQAASATSQMHISENTETADIHSLTLDLEAARREKKTLFDACRSRISELNEPALNNLFKDSSPPSDFFDNLLDILSAALSRASDAAEALEGVSQDCSRLGFSGHGVNDVIADMRSHFRSARLELERVVPGETANVSLEDGKGTLSALVRRVESLAQDLGTERHYHHGSLDREKALRGQFDALLHRYEVAASKIDTLENSIASSAGDMLHTRMRMQDLEREGHDQAVGIDRLNTALDKYHDEVKSLEGLIDNLEKENTAAKDDYARQIFKLRKQVAHERSKRSSAEAAASEYDSRIRELEETVENNRIRACDLTAQVEILEKEHQQAIETLEQTQSELQSHEVNNGTLNVRISDLATSLDGAKSEVQRLGLLNSGLQEQLQIEVEARNELLDKWAADQARSFAHMKETINSDRRRAKVRTANWELKSDDLMSDGTTMGSGSEPITPVSMTRFVDVEVGRGKDRRRMDSGIGILTEDELMNADSISNCRHGLDSDLDLPTSDFA